MNDIIEIPEEKKDKGFTLIELLIVIVILGILATVTVFAVTGITNQGRESACQADFKTLEVAYEAHVAQEGVGVDMPALVAAGFLRSPSTLYSINAAGDLTSTSECADDPFAEETT